MVKGYGLYEDRGDLQYDSVSGMIYAVVYSDIEWLKDFQRRVLRQNSFRRRRGLSERRD